MAAAADDKVTKKSLRPPSFASGVGAALTAVVVFVIPGLLIAPQVRYGYGDYELRAKVLEIVALAASLKEPITAFHEEHKRLWPTSWFRERSLKLSLDITGSGRTSGKQLR